MKGSEKQLYWARNILYFARQHCLKEIRYYAELANKRKFFDIYVFYYKKSLKWLEGITETEEKAGNIINARKAFTPEAIDAMVNDAVKKRMEELRNG